MLYSVAMDAARFAHSVSEKVHAAETTLYEMTYL